MTEDLPQEHKPCFDNLHIECSSSQLPVLIWQSDTHNQLMFPLLNPTAKVEGKPRCYRLNELLLFQYVQRSLALLYSYHRLSRQFHILNLADTGQPIMATWFCESSPVIV